MSEHFCSKPTHDPSGYVAMYWDCDESGWVVASTSPRSTKEEATEDADEFGSPEHIELVWIGSAAEPKEGR